MLGGCQAILDPEVSPSPTPSPILSGIRGVVHLGPMCEDATRASPCIEPYSAELVILDAKDDVVARVTSGTDGRFEVTLPPGIYTIQPVPPANGDLFPAGQDDQRGRGRGRVHRGGRRLRHGHPIRVRLRAASRRRRDLR